MRANLEMLESLLGQKDYSNIDLVAGDIRKIAMEIGDEEVGTAALKLVFAARRKDIEDIRVKYCSVMVKMKSFMQDVG